MKAVPHRWSINYYTEIMIYIYIYCHWQHWHPSLINKNHPGLEIPSGRGPSEPAKTWKLKTCMHNESQHTVYNALIFENCNYTVMMCSVRAFTRMNTYIVEKNVAILPACP